MSFFSVVLVYHVPNAYQMHFQSKNLRRASSLNCFGQFSLNSLELSGDRPKYVMLPWKNIFNFPYVEYISLFSCTWSCISPNVVTIKRVAKNPIMYGVVKGVNNTMDMGGIEMAIVCQSCPRI